MTDEKGESKGFGFVHFETQEAADKAVESVNNMMLNDKKVFVGKFLTKGQRAETNSVSKKKYTNVFVKNFGELLDDEQLKELFSRFGEITSAVVAKFPDGKSKGFGFCNYKEAEAAVKSVDEMNRYQIDNKAIVVVPHQKRQERLSELKRRHEDKKRERRSKYEGVNLYVKNLDDRIDDEALKAEFLKFGEITSAKVMTELGRSKGFGFVCFKRPEDATKAVSEMRGKIVGSKPLYVALAQLKEERRTHLVSQYKNYLTSFRNNQPMYLAQNNQMFIQPGVYPNMFNAIQRGTQPRWNPQAARPANNAAPTYQTYQMYNPIQQAQQQQQQRPRLSQPSIQLRPNTVNRVNYPQLNQQQMIRNGQYVVNGGPIQMQQQAPQVQQQQQQLPQQQVQQQQKRVPKLGKDEQVINIAGQPPLTTDMLASANPQEQKQMLGERLYPLISCIYPEWAGKITGMLLEIDNAELLHMLDSPDSLREKVQEAYNVLEAHQAKAQAQVQQN